jgi:small-conductance mechanosensitive channel
MFPCSLKSKRHFMKIRRDPAFISSVLFTIALLSVLPAIFSLVLAGRDAAHEGDFGIRLCLQEMSVVGNISLAIVLIGLIVTWTGYLKRVRWAWFVMFVVVWGWFFSAFAFHDFAYPIYRGAMSGETEMSYILAMIRAVFTEPPWARDQAHEMMSFALMVIALVLPMKSFFWDRHQ